MKKIIELTPVALERIHVLVPSHMHGGLIRYLECGIEPGHFLYAVLSNDLRRAVERADLTNLHRLADYVKFLYNYAPSSSWGSPERVSDWIRQGAELRGEK
jgi:hypothetical protein